jgi:hypothetical protein
MGKKISRTLTKVQRDTQTASSRSSSNEIKSIVKTLGDPNCPHCSGAGDMAWMFQWDTINSENPNRAYAASDIAKERAAYLL